MSQGYHRSWGHEVMEITSAGDLMAGEPVEAASFHARGFSGFRMLGGSSALAPLLIVVSPPTLDLLSHQLKVLLRPVDTY